MCFSNFHNHFGNMQVFLSFGVYYNSFQDAAQGKEEEKKKKEEMSKDLNNTLSIIEVHAHYRVYRCSKVPRFSYDRSCEGDDGEDEDRTLVLQSSSHTVEVYVFHMFRYYSFGRMRRSADYFLLVSNSQYVSWWSMALSLLVITSGYLQLFFLKRLFVTKPSGEEARPRC